MFTAGIRSFVVGVCVLMCLGGAPAAADPATPTVQAEPTASADPTTSAPATAPTPTVPAPDLSGYTAAVAADYPAVVPAEWANAEAWSGVVFEAPGGQRCSLMSNSRGGWVEVNCWGTMPNGEQGIATAYNYTAGSFTARQGDLTTHNATLGEYRLLPAGSKITQTVDDISATCGVEAAAISCVAERQATGQGANAVRKHGFILSEQGNSAF